MESLEDLKLTHLGIDCLERIFRYLPFADLMNVADSNKQLKKAADLVFLLKHGSKTVMVAGFSSCPKRFRMDYWHEIGYVILSAHLKRTFQMLRCFGHMISKLGVNMQGNRSVDKLELLDFHYGHLIFYIKQYCGESLTEITFLDTPPCGSLHHFVKPFANIHTVGVQSSDLANASLIKLFPKMQRLKYHCQKITDFASIESDALNLEHLEIVPKENWKTEESFRNFRLSQQLQSLAVPFIALYQGMHETLPNLQHLIVKKMPRNIDTSIKFHFKTVKKLEIFSDSLFSMVFSFDKLEEIILNYYTECLRYDNHDQLYDFIHEHPTIKKFEIRICMQLTEVNLSKLINLLPLVEEFHVSCKFSVHDVIRFMNGKKTLKNISIYLINGSNIEIADVQKRLNDKWHGMRFCGGFGPFKFTRI